MEAHTKTFIGEPVQFVQARTARVAYRRFGSGPNLIFLHGWPLSSFTFRKLVPTLSRHFTCYLIDLPGGGETEWTTATDFTWPGQAATVKQVIDELGLAEYFIYGQDSGAMIGRQLVLIDPRARKLVITNTEIPKHRPPFVPLFRLMMFIPGTNFIMRLLLRSRWFLRSAMGFGGSFQDLSLIDGDFTEHIVRPLITSRRRMEGHNRFLRGWSWKLLDTMDVEHARIAIPVLMVWGKNDPTFPLARATEMLGQFPLGNVQIAEVPDAKLFVQEERPELVSKLVSEFLQGVAPGVAGAAEKSS
jgi:haloalkane dehalogenase